MPDTRISRRDPAIPPWEFRNFRQKMLLARRATVKCPHHSGHLNSTLGIRPSPLKGFDQNTEKT
jgi:hypothetical protein